MTLGRFARIYVRALVVVGGAWIAGAVWIVPRLIRLGHRGEGPAALRRMMVGRDATPLADYLGAWRSLATGLTMAGAALAVLVFLIVAWHLSEPGKAARARVADHEREGARVTLSPGDHLRIGASVGLATGFAIGLLLAFLTYVLGVGAPRFLLASADVLWMAPLADLVTFCLAALLVFLIGTLVRPLRSARAVAFLLLLLSAYCIAMVGGWLHWIAALALAAGLAHRLSRYVPPHWDRLRPLAGRAALALALCVVPVALAVRGRHALRERRAVSSLPEAAPDAPNVLLVVLDAVRADHLSAYGYDRRTSPTLERLAARGVTFERALSTANWSLPSHASLFTGRQSHELGTGWTEPLADEFRTLAEALRDRGYLTLAAWGNPHFGLPVYGLDQGFVRSDAAPLAIDRVPLASYAGRTWLPAIRPDLRVHASGSRRAATRNERILSWLERRDGRPFFAFLNYIDAHAPYLPPAPFDTLFARRPRYWIASDSARDYTPEELRELEAAYDHCIAYADHALGELLARLDALGLLENTLVIVTSDHGESFGEHGAMTHFRSLYMPEIHVPLVLSFPGRVPTGRRVRDPVSIRDVPATVLRVLGLPGAEAQAESFPGSSLTRFWEREGAREAGGAAGNPPPLSRFGAAVSILVGELHYIRHPDRREELYDLSSDPDERTDLASRAAWRPRLDAVRAALDAALRDPGSG